MAEDVPENHVVSEDVGMLTGVTESSLETRYISNIAYPDCIGLLTSSKL